jgi:hypothetical protein
MASTACCTTTTTTTAMVLYHQIPIVPRDRYYFVKEKLILNFTNHLFFRNMKIPMVKDYIFDFLIPLNSTLCEPNDEEKDNIPAENCWTRKHYFKETKKIILHYVLESENISFDMVKFMEGYQISWNVNEILPCLKCSFFRWTSSCSSSSSSCCRSVVKACYVYHMIFHSSNHVFIMENNAIQDRNKWKLKCLWYQDSTMMNYYFSWLPEELFDEIIDNFLIRKKTQEGALRIW